MGVSEMVRLVSPRNNCRQAGRQASNHAWSQIRYVYMCRGCRLSVVAEQHGGS